MVFLEKNQYPTLLLENQSYCSGFEVFELCEEIIFIS